jgi:hypothetical protein
MGIVCGMQHQSHHCEENGKNILECKNGSLLVYSAVVTSPPLLNLKMHF